MLEPRGMSCWNLHGMPFRMIFDSGLWLMWELCKIEEKMAHFPVIHAKLHVFKISPSEASSRMFSRSYMVLGHGKKYKLDVSSQMHVVLYRDGGVEVGASTPPHRNHCTTLLYDL